MCYIERMNKLPHEKELSVLQLLTEGNSISSAFRITGVHRDTCSRALVRFGNACLAFLDKEMRDLELQHVEIDETWTFCKKQQNQIIGDEPDIETMGDIYVFTALDHDSRLVPAFRIGKRDVKNTNAFIVDLASRFKFMNMNLMEKVMPITKISTDAWEAYPEAIKLAFGLCAEHDRRGHHEELPDISTSLVERNNLTMRTFMRRLMRKTLGFSKKFANLKAATAMHLAHYNYCWRHKTLGTTPAVAAGVADKRFSLRELYEEVRNCSPKLFESIGQ